MNKLKVRTITFGEGIPKICVPVSGKNPDELFRALQEALLAEPDCVELRADGLQNIFTVTDAEGVRSAAEETIPEILREVRKILKETVLLFTWRTAAEGGGNAAEDPCYAQIVRKAIESGKIDLVDIEHRHPARPSLLRAAKEQKLPVILSEHDFEKTPSGAALTESFLRMEENGADIAKIAVMPRSREDVGILKAAAVCAGEQMEIPLIAIAMGEYGKETRSRAEEIGSCLTFGAVGKGSAPGQIAAEELRKLLLAFHKEFV